MQKYSLLVIALIKTQVVNNSAMFFKQGEGCMKIVNDDRTGSSVSVIIPVYNCEAYVAEAIESILDQPYKMIQIILVNDGSKDGSPAICDQYAAKYDRVHVIHQKNSGVSAARNAGIEWVLASERPEYRNGYIAFLDADDKWQTDFFDESVQAMLQNSQLIGFRSCHCNNKGNRKNDPAPVKEGVYSGNQRNVWKHSSQPFAAMLYSCSLLQKYDLRFMTGLKYGEDTIFRMQCMYLAEQITLHNRLMYYYRHTATSAVHSRKYGISYFVPIIDGWLLSDSLMEKWENDARGALWEGRAMAAVCIVDMCKEHFCCFGRQRELDALFAKRPEYLELITSDFARNRPDSGLKWQAMKAHPVKFMLRCYVEGAVNSITRRIYLLSYKSKWLTAMIDKKRYPILMDGE